MHYMNGMTDLGGSKYNLISFRLNDLKPKRGRYYTVQRSEWSSTGGTIRQSSLSVIVCRHGDVRRIQFLHYQGNQDIRCFNYYSAAQNYPNVEVPICDQ